MVEPMATPATASRAVAQEVFKVTPRARHLLVEVFKDPTRGMATLGSMEAGVYEEGTRSMVMVLGASSGQWITGRGMEAIPGSFLSHLGLHLLRWVDCNNSFMGVVWQVHHRASSRRVNVLL
jgi:hypothetical protein